MKYRKIPFQKLRIFWFGAKQAAAAGAAEARGDIARMSVHKYLAGLAETALKAIGTGQESGFVSVLDFLIKAHNEKLNKHEIQTEVKQLMREFGLDEHLK